MIASAISSDTRVTVSEGTSNRTVRASGMANHSQRPLSAMNGTSSSAYQG